LFEFTASFRFQTPSNRTVLKLFIGYDPILKAAILVEPNNPLVVADIEIPELKAGQAHVDIAFSGVCQTQVLECQGYRGEDRYLPHCMGHEASGVIRRVGPGITKVVPGDRVILSWIKGSGAEVGGTVYKWGDREVNSGGVTTFSDQTVVSENRLTKMPDDMSFRDATLVGCAVPTGLGAVFNTAKPKPGQSIAVFGTGGVGLCAIAGASIAGCTPIIAVDILDEKLKIAKQMGATHTINGLKTDPVEEISRITSGGADFTVEASGRPQVMSQALESLRNHGTAVVIGNAHYGERLDLNPHQFNLGKQLRGTWGGDSWPDQDYPLYCKLLQSGQLNLEPLLTKTYKLDQINDAIEDLADGRVARPLIDMGFE
jgi:S-(hydroxymethyl)glutathione dehydrogenase/alcohol dehydrogenase